MSSLAAVTVLIALSPVVLLFILSMFTKQWRFLLLSAALVLSTVETIYFIARHDLEKEEVLENLDTVERHLRETYPGEQWVTRRREGVFHNHGPIQVIFMNELDAVYEYRVTDNSVEQSGYSGDKTDWKHKE
ncbi:hypothetical protein ACFQPF_14820 [Fictibacillus iocasae]|uniref:DUF3139 domain-containing protein n=1 Tax=Fictibacillus iocasae TaxID=2715437 RepID=A0ABW2NST6_9BACL